VKLVAYAAPFETPETGTLVTVLRDSMADVGAVNPAIVGFGAASDARFFAAAGAQTVVCGPGSLVLAHTTDESIELSEVCAAAIGYASAIRRLLDSRTCRILPLARSSVDFSTHFFDELSVGLAFTKPPRTMTAADTEAFARLTGDAHPQHLDPDWAKRSFSAGASCKARSSSPVRSGSRRSSWATPSTSRQRSQGCARLGRSSAWSCSTGESAIRTTHSPCGLP
jgi:hypothetical protein